jgi:N-acetylmuramoyl-L-alanine amidase
LIAAYITQSGGRLITDNDIETLAQYLKRIQPGDGSVVCEIHFNASASPSATGTETIIPYRHTKEEFALARELSAAINKHTGLLLRGDKGVITERDSHRGSLGLMREEGMNALIEVAFISNQNDLRVYRQNKDNIAREIAAVLIKYDALIK